MAEHVHNWMLTKRRVADDGRIAAELFECLGCPARKWNADPEIYDEWVASLPKSGPIPIEGSAPDAAV